MTSLGIVHTAISVAALGFAFVAIIKKGVIHPYDKTGKYYSILTAIACVTTFPLSKAGGFNAGHALGILILILLGVVYLFIKENAEQKPLLNYVQVFCMTTTLLLSLLPAINETLARIPIGHPLSDSPTSPIVQLCNKILFGLFVVGISVQFYRLRK